MPPEIVYAGMAAVISGLCGAVVALWRRWLRELDLKDKRVMLLENRLGERDAKIVELEAQNHALQEELDGLAK